MSRTGEEKDVGPRPFKALGLDSLSNELLGQSRAVGHVLQENAPLVSIHGPWKLIWGKLKAKWTHSSG